MKQGEEDLARRPPDREDRAHPVEQGRAFSGEEGQALPGEQGRAFSGEEGRALSGEEGRALSGEEGRALSGEEGQALPGEEGQAVPDEEGQALPGEQGRAVPDEERRAISGSVGQAFLPAKHGARLSITRRKLPHWRVPGSIYFVTFRLKTGRLTMPERLLVLDHVRSGHGAFYSLVAGVVMPSHAHIILRPHKGMTLQRILKGIKGVSARRINRRRNRRGALWLDESWDRIVRNHDELLEKINYVLDNPVKASLVNDRREYPASWWSGCTTVEDE